MRHCQFSPVQTDVSDLIQEIIKSAEDVEKLESMRDYGSKQTHKNSNIKHADELYKKYWKYSKGILRIYRLPRNLEDEVIKRFSWLSPLGEIPKISLQIISGGAICIPHKDEERLCSILISINDNSSYTEFFDETIVEDELFPNPNNINLFASIRFRQGENWIFNHKSVHSVQLNQAKRITIAVGFDTVDYNTLKNFVDKYRHGLV